MCRVLGIKSNHYYSYQKRKAQRPIDTTHQEMLEWVKDIAKFSDNTYALSFPISRRKTAQLIKEANVWVRYKKKYKATTNSEHKKPVYANELEQDFDVQKRGCKILSTYGLQKTG
jgi:putative transposase